MRNFILYVSLLSLLITTGCAHGPKTPAPSGDEPAGGVPSKKPKWVITRPVSQMYYTGIGSAEKTTGEREYRQIAKDAALRDLASEITVNISGEFIHNIVEQSGMVEQEVRSHVRSFTQANLEGYELMDAWQDSDEYWVYYRLSKELYERQRRLRIEKAVSLALDMFSKARANERQGRISAALLYYLQALKQLKDYISEPLVVEINGSKVFLTNEIYSSIQHLLSNTELRARGGKPKGKIGQPLRKPLEVFAVYTGNSGREIGISNLPIQFSFTRGSGSLVKSAQTNRHGVVKARVAKITSADKIQVIKAQMNISKLIHEDLPVILRNMVNNLPVPSTKFILDILGLSAYIEANERHFGKRLKILYIEPKLKNMLSDNGFTFVDNTSKADLYIKLKAASRKGTKAYDFYSAYVDMTISVLDLASGDEIYKDAFQSIKGVDLNYQKAGIKAFEAAGEKVVTALTSIIGFQFN
ncbi:MAG: LPP20 family lipoprotein [Planctomycetota bacterium]|jgi:hypothetical protein